MFLTENNLAQKIDRDGFVIIKEVLSRNEVAQLRKIVKKHFK
ncbi:MAG: hypothetical protein WCD18_28065 [Thermosynechococcaceae cyanobacterium]